MAIKKVTLAFPGLSSILSKNANFRVATLIEALRNQKHG